MNFLHYSKINTLKNLSNSQAKIIFFGLGSIGLRLARLIRDNFDCKLFAYRSSRGTPNEFGVDEIYEPRDVEKISPDIAFITNPTFFHMETSIFMASKGIDFFIEKPLSHDKKHWKILLKIIKEQGIVAAVGCQMRFDPMIRFLKGWLSDRKVLYARVQCSSYLPEWRPGRDYTQIYSASRELGGGVLLDLIHEPDYCHWLFGRIYKIEGHAGKISDLSIDSEDYAELSLFHEAGCVTSVHLDYFGRRRKRRMEIFGDEFYVQADFIGRTLGIFTPEKETTRSFDGFDYDSPYLEELRHFFNCTANRSEPMNSLEDHMKVLGPLLDFKKKLTF